MNKLTVAVFENTLQKTHRWLKSICELMGWQEEQAAYLALRGVLHALRDRLPVEVAAKLGAQLPMLIRGLYYEGWVPAHTPIKIHNAADFLELVSSHLNNNLLVAQVEEITKNVFKVMENYLSEGEIDHLRNVLPKPIAAFWDPLEL